MNSSDKTNNRLVFVVNVDWFFLSHRLPLAQYALKKGVEVYLLAANTGKKEMIEKMGIKFIEIPFERSGTNPLHELKCIYLLIKTYKLLKPSVIHHITLKASMLGCIAAKLAGVTSVVNAISGFGYMFTDNRKGFKKAILQGILKLSFSSEHFSFILQNPDDLKIVKELNVAQNNHLFLIKGSGVNLDDYKYTAPIKKRKLEILFPARILKDKGVVEFLKAAKKMEKQYLEKVKFVLAGDCDMENPAVFKEEELIAYLKNEYIEWVGFQKNMIPVYVASDIVVLPSYREGLPKSLIEACAIGRPIVTTDAIGCRECVENGVNGILVPVKDSKKLASAIEFLITNNDKRIVFGIESRKLAERDFSIDSVIEKTFNIYSQYKF